MKIKFQKLSANVIFIKDDWGEGGYRGLGRIDRSPMNEKVWLLDLHSTDKGVEVGYPCLAHAKTAATKSLKKQSKAAKAEKGPT